jgi:two-component system NtrC family sensor kinase
MNQSRWLLLAMLGTVLLVGLAMFLDEQREFELALVALHDEQVALATAVAADFEARLLRLSETGELRDPPGGRKALIAALLGGAIELQQPRSRLLLVRGPGEKGFFTSQGRTVQSEALTRAVAQPRRTVHMLSREAAAQLGLPARLATAGIRRVHTAAGIWSVIVIASAERLRARERHAQVRFVLGLSLLTLLVGGLGGLALRDQRRRLAVARELEIAELQRERERLLARADKMATLAALSSGIAHQIATPLGTITARAEQVLPALANDPKATGALRVISDQVERIQRVIRGVLDLARGNRPTLLRSRPESVLHAALGLVKHRFESLGLVTRVMIARELPEIACDPPMIEQALVNLLLNALDASTPHARVSVQVRAANHEVCFAIEDEGDGISDATAARAGEPFFTTKPKEQGTGLGLAIAQEVVANHGGRLLLERRVDARGTRASIVLPAAD